MAIHMAVCLFVQLLSASMAQQPQKPIVHSPVFVDGRHQPTSLDELWRDSELVVQAVEGKSEPHEVRSAGAPPLDMTLFDGESEVVLHAHSRRVGRGRT